MKRISEVIGKYMAWIVLVIAALALFAPGTCLWIRTGWINYLLMIVMFGMGLTMKLSDFAVVFARPRETAGCHYRLSGAVYCHALAGVFAGKSIWPEQ